MFHLDTVSFFWAHRLLAPCRPHEASAEEIDEMMKQDKVEKAEGAEPMVGVQSTPIHVSEMHLFKSLQDMKLSYVKSKFKNLRNTRCHT